MFVLVEDSNQAFIEHLQSRLQSHGIDCLVSDLGRTGDGEPHFAIQLPLYSQIARARGLL